MPPFSFSAARNALVPDDAITPRFFSSSSAFMPEPLSEIMSVLESLSATMSICHVGLSATSSGWVRPWYLARSMASEALDSSSRRNISFFE